MTKKTKQILIIFVIILMAFVVFKVFFSSTDSSNTTLTTDQTNSAVALEGQDVRILLDKLKSVNLDQSIFSDKIFLSLEDFEKPIAEEISGRPDPFLPIGADSPTTPTETPILKATSTIKAK